MRAVLQSIGWVLLLVAGVVAGLHALAVSDKMPFVVSVAGFSALHSMLRWTLGLAIGASLLASLMPF